MNNPPSRKTVKKLFKYKKGKLYNRRSGVRVGGNDCWKGYRNVRVEGRLCKEHKVIWLIKKGYWPEELDHKDGVRDNNKIDNLRDIGAVGNAQNRKVRKDSKTKIPGVSLYKGSRFTSRLCINGKRNHLGHYESILEAALARHAGEYYCEEWKYPRVKTADLIRKIWPEFKGE